MTQQAAAIQKMIGQRVEIAKQSHLGLVVGQAYPLVVAQVAVLVLAELALLLAVVQVQVLEQML